MKLKHLLVALFFFSGLISVVCGYLVKQNAVYKTENRTLLLQNDSLLSINMDLENELRKYKRNSISRITNISKQATE